MSSVLKASKAEAQSTLKTLKEKKIRKMAPKNVRAVRTGRTVPKTRFCLPAKSLPRSFFFDNLLKNREINSVGNFKVASF
jgi:hypothetical protein